MRWSRTGSPFIVLLVTARGWKFILGAMEIKLVNPSGRVHLISNSPRKRVASVKRAEYLKTNPNEIGYGYALGKGVSPRTSADDALGRKRGGEQREPPDSGRKPKTLFSLLASTLGVMWVLKSIEGQVLLVASMWPLVAGGAKGW